MSQDDHYKGLVRVPVGVVQQQKIPCSLVMRTEYRQNMYPLIGNGDVQMSFSSGTEKQTPVIQHQVVSQQRSV